MQLDCVPTIVQCHRMKVSQYTNYPYTLLSFVSRSLLVYYYYYDRTGIFKAVIVCSLDRRICVKMITMR